MTKKFGMIAASIAVAIVLLLGITTAIQASGSNVPAQSNENIYARTDVIDAGTARTGSFTSALKSWLYYSVADVYINVAHSAVLTNETVNTTTFKIQNSPDNVTWYTVASGPVLTSAASANNVYRINAQGAFYRVLAASTNAGAFTTTIKVVVKP
jgi:hypothetical protein